MNNIPRVSLEDTLSLIQLVRETALAQGREAQANQLSPVMDEMREVVATARKNQPAAAPSQGLMGQADFRKLLDVSQAQAAAPASSPSSAGSALERNRLIQAMSAANMTDVDIARQFGMTREEVRLVLSINQKGISTREVAHD